MTESGLDVAVIGSGSWGTTLARLAAENRHRVVLWCRDAETAAAVNKERRNPRYWPAVELPAGLRATAELEEAALCKTVILAVPSHAMRSVAVPLGDHLGGDHIVVHAAKGIENETLSLMSQIIRRETCVRKIGALSGPNLSAEVMRGDPAATVVASRYEEVVARVQQVLVSDRMRVYGNRDMTGVEIGGAVKNIIAISAGLVTGLGYGDNTKAMLLTRGLTEMVRLGKALGAEAATFSGLSGFGDLVATCASPLSRNQRVGVGLAQGKNLEEILAELGQVAEGVRTARSVFMLAGKLGVEMPITAGIHAILHQGMTPRDVIGRLMTRKAKYETL